MNPLKSRFKNQLRGKKAQASGDRWENILFSNAYRQGFHPCRIPNGCKSIGLNRLIRVESPFDFILSKVPGVVLFLDTKTCGTKNFSHSQLKKHQIEELRFCELAGALAGYLVHFQTINQVVFFSALQLMNLESKKSLKPKDGIILGKELDFNLDLIKGI